MKCLQNILLRSASLVSKKIKELPYYINKMKEPTCLLKWSPICSLKSWIFWERHSATGLFWKLSCQQVFSFSPQADFLSYFGLGYFSWIWDEKRENGSFSAVLARELPPRHVSSACGGHGQRMHSATLSLSTLSFVCAGRKAIVQSPWKYKNPLTHQMCRGGKEVWY